MAHSGANPTSKGGGMPPPTVTAAPGAGQPMMEGKSMKDMKMPKKTVMVNPEVLTDPKAE